jgi:hypothetical protein
VRQINILLRVVYGRSFLPFTESKWNERLGHSEVLQCSSRCCLYPLMTVINPLIRFLGCYKWLLRAVRP